ncbi:RodZ domain-containing protein [Methylotetracoccus oryzae]|uniref:RodZ domain-containing protein n=1 Tax=Methylotetracoccus oryzae TaxID=1919059 RepID=UPI001118C640|nr:RodZ domain-containing protein [Methylotetracoccus oryzae]
MSSNATNSNGLEEEGLCSGPGPGRALREARVARGLSIEEVAGKLHLAVPTVRALETDDYAGLPPAIFIRGYLKNLARLLGLEPNQIVEAYERLGGRDALPESSRVTVLDPVPEESRFGPALVLLGLAAFIGLGWWVYRVAREQVDTPETVAAVPQVTTAAPTAASSPPAEPGRGSAGGGTGQTTGPAPDVPAPSQPAASAVPVQAAGPPSLRVRFLGDSWVSIVDADGSRLLYELGSKGSEKLISGKPPFTVVLGRPAEISLDYKDQPYNHGYTNNRAPARFVIGP